MKRLSYILSLLLLTGILAAGCKTVGDDNMESSPAAGATVIDAEEAKQMMENEDVIIIDVRTAEEFSETHIDGAVLLPLDEITAQAESVMPDKDKTYLIYCRSGNRSSQAAKKLVEMGYRNIYDFGGIMDWPYDTVSGSN